MNDFALIVVFLLIPTLGFLMQIKNVEEGIIEDIFKSKIYFWVGFSLMVSPMFLIMIFKGEV